MRRPVEYIYIDHDGIDSLYAQTVERVESSRETTIQKSVGVKSGAAARLKNLLIKVVSGLEAEVSAELTGGRVRTERSTSSQAVEHRVDLVIENLAKAGYLFHNLLEATQHAKNTEGPVFISVREKFNAPQFYGGAVGFDRVNADGYLLLEIGGPLDYHDGDDYYKQLTTMTLVKLSASIHKLMGGRMMGATSHDAMLFRGFAGRGVPLSMFGGLTSASAYFQIKPFAIWK